MNYTETEAKVREATNDDAWGPTGKYNLIITLPLKKILQFYTIFVTIFVFGCLVILCSFVRRYDAGTCTVDIYLRAIP